MKSIVCLLCRRLGFLSLLSSQHSLLRPKYTSDAEEELQNNLECALPSLDLAVEETHRLLEHQGKQNDALDTKAQVLLGLVGLVLAALYGNLHSVKDMKLDWITLGAIGVAALLFAAAAVAAFWSYRIREWTVTSNPDGIRAYLAWDPQLTKLVLLDTMSASFKRNAEQAKRKAKHVEYAQLLFFSGTCILVLVFIWNLIR